MDDDRARQLLSAERSRIEQAMASTQTAEAQAEAEQEEPGERGSEDLYEKELDVGRAGDLRDQLAAVERAEARLKAGSFGRSVLSGEEIPDERLEALPTAELTIEEQRAQGS